MLSALYIIGVDNVIVEIDNEEIPILDGSSKDFVAILKKVGLKKLDKKKYLKILEKVDLKEDKRKSLLNQAILILKLNFN